MKKTYFIIIAAIVTMVSIGFVVDQEQKVNKANSRMVAQGVCNQEETPVKDMTLEQLMEIPVVETDASAEVK